MDWRHPAAERSLKWTKQRGWPQVDWWHPEWIEGFPRELAAFPGRRHPPEIDQNWMKRSVNIRQLTRKNSIAKMEAFSMDWGLPAASHRLGALCPHAPSREAAYFMVSTLHHIMMIRSNTRRIASPDFPHKDSMVCYPSLWRPRTLLPEKLILDESSTPPGRNWQADEAVGCR